MVFLLASSFSARSAFPQALSPEKATAVSWIDGAKATYDEIAKYCWENPELSLAEVKASAKLTEYLAKNGFKVEKAVSGMPTAFVATWGSGKPVIGFLAEYDALPNLSQRAGTAKQDPIVRGAPGQGCGHNLFGTSSCTAAIGAKVAMEKHGIKGTVKVFGTPAEETAGGKTFMAKDGIFDGTDIMISWHPEDLNGVDYKTFLANKGARYQFKGRSSHAASAPEKGRSALDAVELMNVGVNYMREHVVQEARIHYVITKGGEVPNSVPSDAENWYYIRAPRRAQVEEISAWMLDIARGAELMTQTKMTNSLSIGSWEILPNRTLAVVGDVNVMAIGAPPFTQEDQAFGEEMIKATGREVKGASYDTMITKPDFNKTFPDVPLFKASTDQGVVSWMFPLVVFSAAVKAKGVPQHSWMMASSSGSPAGFKAGLTVSKWMAATALDCFMKPEIIPEAWKELNGYLAQHKSYLPIPADIKLPKFKEIYGIEPEAVPGYKN